MENLPLSEFKRQVSEYINQAYYAGKTFGLTKGEKQVAALVPMSMISRLAELETFYVQVLAERHPAQLTDTDGSATTPTSEVSPE